MPKQIATLLAPEGSPRTVQAVLIAFCLVLVTAIIYATGGTHTAGPQLVYIPIAAAAWYFRASGGLLAGIAGGLLIGPLMPLDVTQNIAQDTTNWVIRLGVFMFLGAALGVGFDSVLSQLADLRRLNDETIRAFVHTIDAKSKHTAQHSENVSRYAVQIGTGLGLSSSEIDRLRWEGLLHDIGKLTIPDDVLNKPGPLDEHEWKLVKRHPAESVRMLQGVSHYQPYLPAICHHHERFDGTGYPDGISGPTIPRDARILAVADSFDAMTSARPYRAAYSFDQALLEIRNGAGTQFDPDMVEALLVSFQTTPEQLATIWPSEQHVKSMT